MPADIALSPVVATFARSGFRKTAMEDVAAALGISRQGLYNRFGSKQALFDWAAKALVDDSLRGALACLDDPAAPLPVRIARALDAWVGCHMAMMRAAPCGGEMIAMASPAPGETARAAERKLVAGMTAAIRLGGPGAAVPRAGSIAQALCWTARGLVHGAPDHAAFRRELESIVALALTR